MALTKCRECGQKVSSEAASCPHCGVSSPSGSLRGVFSRGSRGKGEGCFLQTMNCGCLVFWGFVALLVLGIVLSGAGG